MITYTSVTVVIRSKGLANLAIYNPVLLGYAVFKNYMIHDAGLNFSAITQNTSDSGNSSNVY
jgi:hypothetical protein